MDKLEKELIELKKVLDSKTPEFKDEFKNKLKSLLNNNGELTIDIFMKNKQDVFNALIDALCVIHNSKEYLDVIKKENELTFSKFATFYDVDDKHDIKTYKPTK